MSRKTEEVYDSIVVEHMLGVEYGPLVKIRAESEGTVLDFQLPPDAARQIAQNLMECATRAEYEGDFVSEMERVKIEKHEINLFLAMVRLGEKRRRTAEEADA